MFLSGQHRRNKNLDFNSAHVTCSGQMLSRGTDFDFSLQCYISG